MIQKQKIPDISNLAIKADLNAKITEIEHEIPSISGLATNTELTVVENKISNVSGLIKKNYNTKISGIENKITDHNDGKHVSTPEFNNSAAGAFTARLAQADLVTKTEFDTKLTSLNKKITSNKSKHFLLENELNKLETFDSSYFKDKDKFEEDYLVFKPMYNYFKKIGSTENIAEWKSKG